MSKLVRAPRDMAARKPPHGAPCNRCGLCCYLTKCALGQRVFGYEPGPCPGLMMDSPQSEAACMLVSHPEIPEDYRKAAGIVIGSGLGCDARINGEPINHTFYRELEEDDQRREDEITAARALWGMPPKRR